MKKLLVLAVLLCLVAVLGATAGVVSWDSPTPAGPAPKTVAAVADSISLGKTHLSNHNILDARDAFKQAVTEAPDNQEANFLYGVTRVFAVWQQDYGSTTGLDSVEEIFERSGFTFTAPFSLYNMEAIGPEGVASTTPTTGAVIDFIKTRLLPEVDGAIANLDKVTSSTFSSVISAEALATYGGTLTADHADALAIKALLNLVKCNLNLLVVYGPDVNIPDVAAAPDQLMTYKQLFMADPTFLTPKEVTRLTTAKTALTDFIDTFNAAALKLQARPGQGQHLFVVDVPWESVTNEPIDTSSDSLAETTQMLATVKASLTTAQTFPGSGPVQDRTLDLSKFFNAASPISIRASLSDCAGNLAFPDPTFKGLFPLGVSGHQEMVANAGPHVLGLTCADKGAPLLDVEDDGLWFGYGQAGPKPVYLYNRGTGPLEVSAVGFTGEDAGSFTVDKGTCSSLTPTLSAGSSCNLMVNVAPSTYGYNWAELAILSDDPGEPVMLSEVSSYLQPPAGGTLSGTMKDAATGAGVSGYVEFYSAGRYQGYAYAGSNGAYSISGLPSGTYKIWANPWDGGYAKQWYSNKMTQEAADTVVLTTAPLTVAPILLSKGVSLSGMVKDAVTNAGVGNVVVTLYPPDSDSPVTSYNTYNGSYSFTVAPGSYRVQVNNSGGGGEYLPKWYNAGAATAVTSSTVLSDILLSKGGAISGRLTDAVSGAPVAYSPVYIHDAQSGDYFKSGSTNGDGTYSVNGLPSGTYKVYFDRNSLYYGIWYGNVTARDQATAVTVTAPNTTAGIDGAMNRGGSISGTVTDDEGHPLSYLRVIATDSRDEDYGVDTDYSGNYTLNSLVPGVYRVEFEGGDQGFVPQNYSNGYHADEFQTVQVTASNTATGINATLSRGGSISGRITDGSAAPVAGVEVDIYDAYGNELFDTETDSDGRYLVRGLPTGSYKVGVRGYQQGYVGAFYGGAVRLSEAALVKVYAPLATLDVDLVVAKGGSISGTITNSAGAPAPDAWVHVFDAEGVWISDAEADQLGRYKAEGLPAGSFKLLVESVENGLAGQWYNGKGSYATATAVSVASLADVTGVNVTLGTGAMLVSPTMTADFGKVLTSADDVFKIVEIYNTGTQSLVLGTVNVSGANASEFTLSNDRCSGKTLPPGVGECTVRVSFSPSSQAAKNAQLNVPYNSAGTPVLNIALKGTGVGSLPAGFTGTTLTSSANPSVQGQPVTFTATVVPVGPASATPTGSVTFKNGSTVLGSANLNAGGTASFSSSALAIGNHGITASYAGSSSYNGSTSATLTQVVRTPQATLTVTVDGSGSVNSSPTGINCAGASGTGCSASFQGGSTVTLTPTAAFYSTFDGWSGACTGSGACQVVMDSAKNVTASFTAQPATVRIDGVTDLYYTLGGTLDAVDAPGRTVRSKADVFTEEVIMSTPQVIRLLGGFTDSLFGTRTDSSFTVLRGSLKIRRGELKVERLKVR